MQGEEEEEKKKLLRKNKKKNKAIQMESSTKKTQGVSALCAQ